MVKKDKKLCVSLCISGTVHQMMISPAIFFHFFKILLFGGFRGGWRGKIAKYDLELPISVCHAL